MEIAIIGIGNVGGALARTWADAGHRINLGARDSGSEKALKLAAYNSNIIITDVKSAVGKSDVVLIAAQSEHSVNIANSLGNVQGKIIIDAMNSIRTKPEPYDSSYFALKSILKTDSIVKCFNTTGFENMESPDYGDLSLDMFMAGNSENAKTIASKLATDAGFAECYDIGGDDRVSLLESFAMFWINLAIIRGYGRNIGFKLLKK